MSIVLRQEKAKAWLAAKLNELTPEQFNAADHPSPFPEKNIPECPDERREFLYGASYVYLLPGYPITNPFLGNAIMFLAEKYPQQMADAARAFGVKDCNCKARGTENCNCLAEALCMAPWRLIEKLPTVHCDGKQTIFKLMANALIPEPLTDQQWMFVRIGEYIQGLPPETQEVRKEVLSAIETHVSFRCGKRTAEKAIKWLEDTYRYKPQWPRRCADNKTLVKKAYQKAPQHHA